MRDPRCWREVFLRGGLMTVLAAISYFLLGAEAWVWWIPVGVVLLVLFKWLVRPAELDEELPEGEAGGKPPRDESKM
ncbi:MAG: hypothetical protein J7M05_14080 [Anaerolineae bacterium]|nr:hypothetical protein [Anaerolineae bacterium]